MKIEKIGSEQVIQSADPASYFSYFGWPSVARLQDGRIAVVSSGFRNNHTCPFGKVVISYSDDECRTFSCPAVAIDTPLDDRDGGILAYGENTVMITSFTSRVSDLKNRAGDDPMWNAYIDNCIPPDADEKYFGSVYRISTDCGKTFGPLKKAPVTSPHGPIAMPDGSLLWTGNHMDVSCGQDDMKVYVYRMTPDEVFVPLGSIGPILDESGKPMEANEPHTCLLPDGTLLCHIRVEKGYNDDAEYFTTYQSESKDGGKTWSKPHRILPKLGGATPHLLLHSSGTLISAVERRQPPFEIRVMLSDDSGQDWYTDNFIFSRGFYRDDRIYSYMDYPLSDLGYPATVELDDGSLFTVFYSRYPGAGDKASILGQRWRIVRD